MKKIILLLSTLIGLFASDIVVYNNEYNILKLDKKIKKLIVGNKEMINVSVLNSSNQKGTLLKIFGKKSGNTSILLMYRDSTFENYHVYVNQNLGYIQKMINVIEPNLKLSRVGDGSTIINGTFENPHDKKRIYSLLTNAGIDINSTMDLTETKQVNKMVRTKLYLVEVNNLKAEDLGGVTGLDFFSEYVNLAVNPLSANGATFSGWLLDNTQGFTSQTGQSVSGTLNFLVETGIGTILDDTVLMSTEDENASFRVGGEVYIPTGITQNAGIAPTIQVQEKEYGLELSLNSTFMEKDDYVHININILDSEFDTNKDHDVQLGLGIAIPSFISKSIQTNVVVKSGQVIVLGGRLHTEDYDQEDKVPFLGDIPLIGELFTHTVSATKSNDLLFFLVPEIVDANEAIDETRYYRDFKEDAKVFHEKMLDLNATKDDSLVVLTDEEPMRNDEVKHVTTEQIAVIELEDHSVDKNTTVFKEIVLEDNESNTSEIVEVSEVKISVDEQPVQNTNEVLKSTSSQKYVVASEKIFLRDKPATGFRTNVWIKGHEFTVSEEKVINGSTWFKVGDNCYKGCLPESRELWIAKKYTEEL